MEQIAKKLEKEINISLRDYSRRLNIPIKPIVVGWTENSLILNGGNYSEDVEYGLNPHRLKVDRIKNGN